MAVKTPKKAEPEPIKWEVWTTGDGRVAMDFFGRRFGMDAMAALQLARALMDCGLDGLEALEDPDLALKFARLDTARRYLAQQQAK